MFSDDTSILITNANHDELIFDFKSVLSQISKCFQAIQLILNTEKTRFLKSYDRAS
jgi:hypothetical protein